MVRVHVEKTTALSQQVISYHFSGSNSVIYTQHVWSIVTISLKNRKNIEYSVYHSASNKVVELFGSKQLPRNSPIVAYVTGGYWSELSGEVSAYTVGPLHAEGIVTAVLHYDRAPGGEFMKHCTMH